LVRDAHGCIDQLSDVQPINGVANYVVGLCYLSQYCDMGEWAMIPADCTDYFTLADGTRVCTIRPHDSPHVFCENLVKTGMCPRELK